MTDIRAQIQTDLKRCRVLNIEAKALRARLSQIASLRSELSVAMIALRHDVPLHLVHSLAKSMSWTQDEKPPHGTLPTYDAHHVS
jgi:hypothetical protein